MNDTKTIDDLVKPSCPTTDDISRIAYEKMLKRIARNYENITGDELETDQTGKPEQKIESSPSYKKAKELAQYTYIRNHYTPGIITEFKDFIPDRAFYIRHLGVSWDLGPEIFSSIEPIIRPIYLWAESNGIFTLVNRAGEMFQLLEIPTGCTIDTKTGKLLYNDGRPVYGTVELYKVRGILEDREDLVEYPQLSVGINPEAIIQASKDMNQSGKRYSTMQEYCMDTKKNDKEMN